MTAALLGRQPNVGATVLDIGAGTGANSRCLADAGYWVVAVELDAALVRRFDGGRGVQLCRADGTRLPLADSSIDGAISVEVLEHVADPAALLGEAHRVLRPGSPFTVAVPTGYTERLYASVHPRYTSNASHRTRFDRTGLIDFLTTAGFRVERIETANLAAAMAWTVHSVLRTRADHTGAVQENQVVDRLVWRAETVWRRVAPGSHGWLEQRVGKSWYAYCTA